MDLTNPDLRLARAQEQLSCELDGEIAILNLGSKTYFGLTEVGAIVWRALETPKNFNAIVAAVTAEFEVDPVRCRRDILEFLDALKDRGLLEVEQEPI